MCFFDFIILYFILCAIDSGLWKHKVIVTSLNCICKQSRGVQKSPNCRSSYNILGKKGKGKMDDDRSTANEYKGVQNLGRAEISSCMKVFAFV